MPLARAREDRSAPRGRRDDHGRRSRAVSVRGASRDAGAPLLAGPLWGVFVCGVAAARGLASFGPKSKPKELNRWRANPLSGSTPSRKVQ